jgi:hypothetical protein
MADSKASESKAVVPPSTPEEVEQLRAAQEDEYGVWVAVTPIAFNGALAYLPGDPVPVSNVKAHGYDKAGAVKKITDSEGQAVIAAVHAAATTNPSVEVAPPVSLGVPVNDK